MKNNNIKKLVEQWEIKKFLEPFEGEKVSVYVLTIAGVDFSMSNATVKYTDDIIEFKSLEIDETTEVARVKAKTENGTFVKFTYKNI